MSDAQATFALNLEDGTSDAATSAAKALTQLRGQIDADTKALRDMQRAMKNLQGGTAVNIAQARELKEQIAGKKASIAQAQSAYLGLGGTFGKVSRGGRDTRSTFALLAQAAKGMPGPLGVLVQRFGSLKGLLVGGAIALGIVGIVAGLGLLVAATAAAAAGLLRYGIAQADARRSELLRIEGLTKIRNIYGLAAGNAGEMQSAIDRVSGSVALGRDKVAQYSEQLYRMGLRGANLEAALEGVAIKAATQGDAQAKMFAGWAAGAARTGQSVRRLADDVKARLGGIAARQMLALDVQSAKLRENFSALFSGLKLEGFLKALGSITELFSQNTATGRALKLMLETLFQPLIGTAESAAPIMKRFFQGMTIAALRTGIVVLQLRNWFRRTFGDPEVLKGFDATTAALEAGKWALGALALGLILATGLAAGLAVKLGAMLVPVLITAAVKMWALAGAGLALASPFLLGALAIGLLAAAAFMLYRAFADANWTGLGDQILDGLGLLDLVNAWRSISWTGLGGQIVDGLVTGVAGSAGQLLSAVQELAANAWTGFKKRLGIASPSKAFAQLGLAIPQGVSAGIGRGKPALQRSVRSVVEVPRVPALAGDDASGGMAPSSTQRSGAPVTFTFGDIHVHSQSSEPRAMALDFRRELERVLEGVALELGARTPEPA